MKNPDATFDVQGAPLRSIAAFSDTSASLIRFPAVSFTAFATWHSAATFSESDVSTFARASSLENRCSARTSAPPCKGCSPLPSSRSSA